MLTGGEELIVIGYLFPDSKPCRPGFEFRFFLELKTFCRIFNYKLRTMNYELSTINYELSSMNNELFYLTPET